MKKVLSIIVLFAALFVSCEKKNPVDPVPPVDPEQKDSTTAIYRIQVQPMGATIFYMLYEDESGKGFVFPIYKAEGAEDVELGKLYTINEMNRTYTYWMLEDYVTHSLYTEATFIKTKDEDGLVLIKATATDQNGDSWNLVYDESKL